MGSKLNPADLRRWRAEGQTFAQIVQRLAESGIEASLTKVWKSCLRAGAPRSYGPGAGQKWRRGPLHRHLRWKKARDAGATLQQIATAAKVSRQAVHRALLKLDAGA